MQMKNFLLKELSDFSAIESTKDKISEAKFRKEYDNLPRYRQELMKK